MIRFMLLSLLLVTVLVQSADAQYRIQVLTDENALNSISLDNVEFLAEILSAEVLFSSTKATAAVLSVPEGFYPLLRQQIPHFRDCSRIPTECDAQVFFARFAALAEHESALRALLEGVGGVEGIRRLYFEDQVILQYQVSLAALQVVDRDPIVTWIDLLYGWPQGVDNPFTPPHGTAIIGKSRRFSVSAVFATSDRLGGARAVELSSESAAFWFFKPDNLELNVKILDGCGFNGHYWVFAAGLTDVEVQLRVLDNEGQVENVYTNALGTAFQPIRDTTAFRCPSRAGDRD